MNTRVEVVKVKGDVVQVEQVAAPFDIIEVDFQNMKGDWTVGSHGTLIEMNGVNVFYTDLQFEDVSNNWIKK